MMLARMAAMGGAAAAGGKSYALWNPNDKGTALTLSNGFLTATVVTGTCSVRATLGFTTGKWYWEHVWNSGGSVILFGVGTTAQNITSDHPGGGVASWAYRSYNGQKYNNGTGMAYGATFTAGDVIGVALDMTAGTLTFYKNGVSQGVAYSGLTGTLYPMVGSNNNGVVSTTNFGATAFAYPVPSGYNSGVYFNWTVPTSLGSTATWNPSDKGANITLSNGNLKAGNSGSRSLVRATLSKAAGRYYWEESVSTLSTDYAVGIASASAGIADGNWLGSDSYAYGWFATGNVYKNGINVSSIAGYALNDVLGFALDCTSGTLGIYKNSTKMVTLTGITLGTIFPACGGALSSTSSGTANFGASGFPFGIPLGFNPGFGSGAGISTYTTLDPATKGSFVTLSGGNLNWSHGGGAYTGSGAKATQAMTTGKWYWEVTAGSSSTNMTIGICDSTFNVATQGFPGIDTHGWSYYSNGQSYYNQPGAGSSYGASYTTGDVIGVALDMDQGTLTFYKNGVSQGVAFTGLAGKTLYPAVATGNTASAAATFNFGASAGSYVAPPGHNPGVYT